MKNKRKILKFNIANQKASIDNNLTIIKVKIALKKVKALLVENCLSLIELSIDWRNILPIAIKSIAVSNLWALFDKKFHPTIFL